jgi:hypothetical protein
VAIAAGAEPGAVSRARGPSWIDPHAPQAGQRPAHCEIGWPHSEHDKSVLTLPTGGP